MPAAIKRNRTLHADLHYLCALLPGAGAGTGREARLELTCDGPERVAQLLGGRLPRPVTGRGEDGPAAIRALRDEVDRLVRGDTDAG